MAHLSLVDSLDAPLAGDDAAEAAWFSIANLPETAFDHAEILVDSLRILLDGLELEDFRSDSVTDL